MHCAVVRLRGGFREIRLERLGVRDVLELLGRLVVLIIVVEVHERELFGRERREILLLVGAEHGRKCAGFRHPVELLAA